MSLIHDALKKAQDKDKATLGGGLSAFQEPLQVDHPKISKRTIVIAGILVLALAYFAYTRFSGEKNETTAPAPKSALPATGQAAAAGTAAVGTDAVSLKKMAIDAYNEDDLETAWSSLTAASNMNDKDPEIWNNLGLVARKRGDAAKAREAYEKALELKSDYPEALNNLAVLDMQAGDNAKALQLLNKALSLNPNYPEANLHLAVIYDQKGDKKKAAELYKKFLEVGKNLSATVIDSVRERVVEIEP